MQHTGMAWGQGQSQVAQQQQQQQSRQGQGMRGQGMMAQQPGLRMDQAWQQQQQQQQGFGANNWNGRAIGGQGMGSAAGMLGGGQQVSYRVGMVPGSAGVPTAGVAMDVRGGAMQGNESRVIPGGLGTGATAMSGMGSQGLR